MDKVKSIALIILTIIIVIVVIQNVEAVMIRFLFWDLSLSLIVLLPLLFAMGFLAGSLTAKIKQKKSTS